MCCCPNVSTSTPAKGPGSGARAPTPGREDPPIPAPQGNVPVPLCLCTLRLGQDNDVAGQTDIAGRPALQRDGVAVEVVQHLQDGGEAEVLDAALASLRQREPQVLWGEAGTHHYSTSSLAGGDDGGTQGYLGVRGKSCISMMCCMPSFPWGILPPRSGHRNTSPL